MSSSEIADNRWEVSASKPPVMTGGGLLQLLMIGGFTLLFGYITASSVVAIVTPKKEGTALHEQYDKMKQNDAAPAKTE
jgi:hypothetical protein